MYVAIGDSAHILPVTIQMPTHRDPIGDGALSLRRRLTRALRRWEITIPDRQKNVDPVLGLLELAQGDTAIWFDGAGAIEVAEPQLIGIGNGAKTDFAFLHRNVFVASAVIYLNGAPTSAWAPLGGDGIIADNIRFNAAPALGVEVR